MFTIDITKIPNSPGVYLFKDRRGDILYIGKAKDLQKRIGQYFALNSLRKQEMLEKADKLDFLMVKNESEALYLEDNLIKEHQPFYNNLLKADNSYVYIKITKEAFPQIFMTRKRINDGALYIGPKNNTIQLKKFLQYLRQILKFRGCRTSEFKKGKLCSDYYFGLCAGRCTLAKNTKAPLDKGGKQKGGFGGTQGLAGEPEDLVDYKDLITTITSFFKGNTKPIETEIHKQIEIAIIHENFERAAQLRDIYQSLQGFVEKQNVVLPERKDGYLAIVKSIGAQFIYTVLVFTQGKLIDVINSKEQQSDIDEDSLYLAIQRTFGPGEVKKQKNETHILGTKVPLDVSTTVGKGGLSFAKSKGKQKGGFGKAQSLTSDPEDLKGNEGGFKWKPKTLKPIITLAENFLESYIISQTLQEESTMINDMFATLKARYGLKNIPYRIECIDISHLSGGRTSGGLSCFMAGLPYKKGYRRYKIQAKKSDDYEALQELLERRIKSGGELPNVLIIDGGKGQLGIVKKLCKENPERKRIVSQIDIISLGKGAARTKSSIGKDKKTRRQGLSSFSSKEGVPFRVEDLKGVGDPITEIIYTLSPDLKIHEIPMTYDQADKIFLKARDEAHRFANSYRKKQMSQEFKHK